MVTCTLITSGYKLLLACKYVINLSVVRGASIKPAGDLIIVHALNRGADEVMSLAYTARKEGGVSVVTHEVSSIVDPEHERKVANDIDEALWEEVETSLRHQSRTTVNYLVLMSLGGAVATTGFVEGSTSQAISFVAASIIAPGFEPLAKIPVASPYAAGMRQQEAWRQRASVT